MASLSCPVLSLVCQVDSLATNANFSFDPPLLLSRSLFLSAYHQFDGFVSGLNLNLNAVSINLWAVISTHTFYVSLEDAILSSRIPTISASCTHILSLLNSTPSAPVLPTQAKLFSLFAAKHSFRAVGELLGETS